MARRLSIERYLGSKVIQGDSLSGRAASAKAIQFYLFADEMKTGLLHSRRIVINTLFRTGNNNAIGLFGVVAALYCQPLAQMKVQSLLFWGDQRHNVDKWIFCRV